MRKILISALFIFAVLTISTSCGFADDEIYSIEINQAYTKMPYLTAYFYVNKSDGSLAQFKGAETFTAFVGDRQVQILEILTPDKITEGTAYIFLIDISKSLKPKQFKELTNNVLKWIDVLKDKDMAAIMTFGKEVKTIKPFTGNKEELKKTVSELQQTDYKTRLYGALKHAVQWSQSHIETASPRRAIVILSDGIDDFEGGETKGEVLRALAVNQVPIYALGFSEPPMNPKKEEGLKTLGEFAHVSGGRYVKVGAENFNIFFEKLRKSLYEVYSLKIDCSQCQADGKTYRLQLNLNIGQKILSDSIDIRIMASSMPATTAEQKPTQWWERIPLWGYLIAIGFLIMAAVFVIIIIRKNRQKAEAAKKAIEEAKKAEEESRKTSKIDIAPLTIKDLSDEAKGLKIRLDKIGIYNREIKYRTNIVNNLTLGRSGCDVTITGDDEISKQHCQIVYDKGNLFLIDLNSTNGTYLNGVPIKEAQKIINGDIIMLGRTELRVTFGDE